MRSTNNNSALSSLLSGRTLSPAISAFYEQGILRWQLLCSQTPTNWSLNYPTSAISIGGGDLLVSAFSGGTLRVKRMSSSTPSDWTFATSTLSYSPASLRGGFVRDFGTVYFFYANWSWGGQPTVRRVAWTGSSFSSPVNIATLPDQMIDTSSYLCRVEAVQPINKDAVLVAVGKHYPGQIATIEFYYAFSDGNWARSIHTVQATLNTSDHPYVNWHETDWWSSWVCASAGPSNRVVVVANSAPNGIPVLWTYVNGVESAQTNPTYIDSVDAYVKYYPSSLALINGRLALSGRMERISSDKVYTTTVECVGFSSDGINFSVGDISGFVNDANIAGTIAAPAPGDQHLYYAGAGRCFRAAMRPVDGGPSQSVSQHIVRVEHEATDQGNDNATVIASEAIGLREGDLLRLELGYRDDNLGAILAPMGRYAVMEDPINFDLKGLSKVNAFRLMNYGYWLIKNWKSPIDIERWTMTRVSDPLRKPGKVILKSPSVTAEWKDTAGLQVKSVNDPVIAQAVTRDSRDGVLRSSVTFGNHNGYAQSGFAFICGMKDINWLSVYIPAASSWSPYAITQPHVCYPKIDPENKFAFARHANPLRVTALTGMDYDTVLKPAGNVSYIVQQSFQAQLGKRYDFVCRRSGCEIQVYARQNDYQASTFASQATMSLILRARIVGQNVIRYGDYCGFAMGVDTWAQQGSGAFGEYEDAVISLTSSSERFDKSSFGNFLFSAQRDRTLYYRFNITPPNSVTAGMTVRIIFPNYIDNKYTIAAVGPNYIDVYNYRSSTYAYFPMTFDVFHFYSLSSFPNEWYASTYSGYSTDSINGVTVITDPSGQKTAKPMRGRAAIVSDDSTAISLRLGDFDGLLFKMLSGSHYITGGGQNGGPGTAGGTFEGFDMTSPLANPRTWRLIFPHGIFFNGLASQFGLPNHGYFMVGNEIMRYVPFTYYSPGARPGNFGTPRYVTMCPVWMAPLKAAPANTTTLSNKWFASLGWIPGDDFGTIASANDVYGVPWTPQGLLVEVLSRNISRRYNPSAPIETYRIQSVTQGANNAEDSTSFITLDKPYPNDVIGPGPSGGDICKVTGRAQLGTEKEPHLPSDWVSYYPAIGDQPLGPLMTAHYFGFAAGTANSLEDNLAALCGLTGVPSCSVDSEYSHTGGGNVTTSLDYHDAIVSVSGVFGSTNYYTVVFRGYFWVSVKFNTDNTVSLRLHAPLSPIAAHGGMKTLEFVTVPYGEIHNVGSQHHVIRYVAYKNVLTVEIDGQHIWSFDIAPLKDLIGESHSGLISHGYTNASGAWVSGNSVTTTISGGFAEVEQFAIDMGLPAENAIRMLLEGRRIGIRPLPNGGLRWTRWASRQNHDPVVPISTSIRSASQSISGHVVVEGLEIADYIDADWLRENGYRFDVAQNPLLMTSADARLEGRYVVRDGKSAAFTHELKTVFYPRLEPGDRFSYSISALGDVGVLQNQDCVAKLIRTVVESGQAISDIGAEAYYA